MLVFIDDSGDPGFRVDKGSSKTFIICCIIFDDDLEAEKTALKIKELRKKMGKGDKFEFKFNKCSREYREAFLNEIKACKFRIRAIVMQKDKIYGKELINKKESFYNYTVKMVLKHSFGKIKNAKVRIDGSGDRLFRKQLFTYLRKELDNKNTKIIKDIKIRDSKRDALIQLADMVAGTISRTYDKDKTDAQIYWNIIKNKKEDIWEFGK